MERIELLINKLREQFEQRASPAQLQMTVQLLQNELAQHQANGAKTLGTSKVAVIDTYCFTKVFNRGFL